MVSIEVSGTHLLTDPLLRGRVGPLRWYGPRPPTSLANRVDAVLISHLHRDHLDLPSLSQFDEQTTVVVPKGAGELVTRGAVVEVVAGERITVGAVTVRVVQAVHPAGRDPWRSRPRAQPVGYLVEGSSRVYFAGDTAVFAGMADLGPGVDVALMPVGGWGLTLGAGHLDPAAALEALRLIRPRTAVPIHWRSLRVPLLWRTRPALFTRPGLRLAEHARALHATTVVVADPGAPVPIPA
jgi:L-ascorbate metabolism protein UlaG (beta-lactamase superfamily)